MQSWNFNELSFSLMAYESGGDWLDNFHIEGSNQAYLTANGDGNRLSLSAENQLRAAGVEQVKLVGVAAHGGVVLLDKVPAHLIFGDLILLLVGGRGGCRGGGLRGLEAGSSVHSDRSMVVGFGVTVLGRVVAIDGNLSHVGHGVGLRGFIFGFGWKMRLKVTERGKNDGRYYKGFFFLGQKASDELSRKMEMFVSLASLVSH